MFHLAFEMLCKLEGLYLSKRLRRLVTEVRNRNRCDDLMTISGLSQYCRRRPRQGEPGHLCETAKQPPWADTEATGSLLWASTEYLENKHKIV